MELALRKRRVKDVAALIEAEQGGFVATRDQLLKSLRYGERSAEILELLLRHFQEKTLADQNINAKVERMMRKGRLGQLHCIEVLLNRFPNEFTESVGVLVPDMIWSPNANAKGHVQWLMALGWKVRPEEMMKQWEAERVAYYGALRLSLDVEAMIREAPEPLSPPLLRIQPGGSMLEQSSRQIILNIWTRVYGPTGFKLWGELENQTFLNALISGVLSVVDTYHYPIENSIGDLFECALKGGHHPLEDNAMGKLVSYRKEATDSKSERDQEGIEQLIALMRPFALWSIRKHHLWPSQFRVAVLQLLLICYRSNVVRDIRLMLVSDLANCWFDY